MALFDQKNFNGEVFGKYVDAVENLNRNQLLKSGALVEKPQYASMLPDQVGGNYITVPIKARISGEADNYDGNTDITASSRGTYTHGRIVVGRAKGWTEKDFTTDISGRVLGRCRPEHTAGNLKGYIFHDRKRELGVCQ